MKILILGGTGAMGEELVPLLAENKDNQLVVTSRRKLNSSNNITYVQGNAKDIYFIKSLLTDEYDIIVDFMLYSVEEFRNRFEMFLKHSQQYLFFSSSRVYAASDIPVTETSDRLLDISKDADYLRTGEYSLTKAKEEDMLKASWHRNWVIIRPYKTYSKNRLQLGVFEKDEWLYRAISGKTVVIPGDIKNLYTSLTSSEDTAKVLNRIIGDYSLNGETIQIANPEKITWGQVIKLYSDCIEKNCGHGMRTFYCKDTAEIEFMFNNKYRLKYDGLIDRVFDDKKVKSLMGEQFSWTSVRIGLAAAMGYAIKQYERDIAGTMRYIVENYSIDGFFDRLVGERCFLSTIRGMKNRLKYLLWRSFDAQFIFKVKKLLHR